MKRLSKENINTPELSDKIFVDRWKSCPHWVDIERYKTLASRFQGGRYVDVGCFNSPMPYELKLQFPDADIQGLDHAPLVIETMQKLFPTVRYSFWELPSLPYEEDSIDYIVVGETLEHLENPRGFLFECLRVLKRNGVLAVSVPKDDVGNITQEHLWSFEPKDFEEFLCKHGTVEVSVFTQGESEMWLMFFTKL